MIVNNSKDSSPSKRRSTEDDSDSPVPKKIKIEKDIEKDDNNNKKNNNNSSKTITSTPSSSESSESNSGKDTKILDKNNNLSSTNKDKKENKFNEDNETKDKKLKTEDENNNNDNNNDDDEKNNNNDTNNNNNNTDDKSDKKKDSSSDAEEETTDNPLVTKFVFDGVEYPYKERPAVLEEMNGVIEFRVVNNDNSKEHMMILTGLKNIFQKQLPKMPREYIARLVFDRSHVSIAVIRKPLTVVGGITFRPFESRTFAEIVFCAISSTEQVRGYGAHLMNHLKDYVRNAYDSRIMHFLTYADNYAIGYFKKQGFTKEITLDKSLWMGYIKDYEGGTIMQCTMLPRIRYLDANKILLIQKAAIMRKIREISKSHIVRPGLTIFRTKQNTSTTPTTTTISTNSNTNSNKSKAKASSNNNKNKKKKKRGNKIGDDDENENENDNNNNNDEDNNNDDDENNGEDNNNNNNEEEIDPDIPTIDPMTIPGLKEAGWTPEMDEIARRPKRSPHFPVMQSLLSEMQSHPSAWPFSQPVNRDEVADYYEVITEPMDLMTMEQRLEADAYSSFEQFLYDSRLIFNNCRKYNNETTTYYKHATKLEKFLYSKIKEYPEYSYVLE